MHAGKLSFPCVGSVESVMRGAKGGTYVLESTRNSGNRMTCRRRLCSGSDLGAECTEIVNSVSAPKIQTKVPPPC